MGVGGHRHAPVTSPPAKFLVAHCRGGLMGLRFGLGGFGEEKTSSSTGVRTSAIRYTDYPMNFFFFFVAQQPFSGLGHLILRFPVHTRTHHTLWDSSGRVTGPSQRPVPDSTQHSQETDIQALAGLETANTARERPQTARPLGSAL